MWDSSLNAEEAFCIKAMDTVAHKQPRAIPLFDSSPLSLQDFPKIKRKCGFSSAIYVNPVLLGILITQTHPWQLLSGQASVFKDGDLNLDRIRSRKSFWSEHRVILHLTIIKMKLEFSTLFLCEEIKNGNYTAAAVVDNCSIFQKRHFWNTVFGHFCGNSV